MTSQLSPFWIYYRVTKEHLRLSHRLRRPSFASATVDLFLADVFLFERKRKEANTDLKGLSNIAPYYIFL